MFTEVPVTEFVDDVDLPCPSNAIPMPLPLVSVVPMQDADGEEASEVEVDVPQENIELLSVFGMPPLQRAAKMGAQTRLDRLAKRYRAAPRDVECLACGPGEQTKGQGGQGGS